MENNLFQQFLPCAFGSLESLQLHLNPEFTFSSEHPKAKKASKTRGRKKLRPGNPLKTEVMDKFWLRLFRSFVKSHLDSICSSSSDKDFWKWFISKGKPGKHCNFLSYNKEYRERIFANPSFCALFAAWGMNPGYCLNLRNNLKESWTFYFDYLTCELVPKAFLLAVPEEFNCFFSLLSSELAKKLQVKS